MVVLLLAAAIAGLPEQWVHRSEAAAIASPAQTAADALFATDQNFSASGSGLGLPDALAAMFHENVVMPLPNGSFAVGKEAVVAALRNNPANAMMGVSWKPIRAGISGDGQHGFTYGFMTMFNNGQKTGRAKYLSYWVNGADGWRVAAFKRAPSPDGEISLDRRASAAPANLVPPSDDESLIESYKRSLAAAETAFSERAQRVGLGPAFVEFGSADAMQIGRQADFIFGNEAIGASMAPEGSKSVLTWSADHGVLVASSGDLGVTFGFIRWTDPARARQSGPIPFFTIWRRTDPSQPWLYVAE